VSDIKLFRIADGQTTELQGLASDLERPLQTLIEKNLDALLGVRFLATEYSTGKTHAGRIDTLGLDENDCPVILEYKRSSGENVINQGLFYLDWLMDHQAEFKLLVLKHFGNATAGTIDWSAPRLICIAADFTKYDAHAVQQMNRNIELIRYRRFGTDLLLFELVNAVTSKTVTGSRRIGGKTTNNITKTSRIGGADKTVAEWLTDMTPPIRELFESLEGYLLSLGDDVQRKDLKLYIAFKRIKNFTTVVIQKDRLYLYLRLDPDHVELIKGFSRDVRAIGHWGTGNLEIVLKNQADLERAKTLIRQAYDGGPSATDALS
jgi:predicted transport protein